MAMEAITPQQQRFVDEYLIDLNAKQAAIRAGYSAKTAEVQGSRLLSNVKVAAVIVKAKEARSNRTQITADRVLCELAKIGFSDPRQVMTWGPAGVGLRPSSELSDDEAACVAEVSQTISKDGGSLRVKMHDKQAALVSIGRHLGMFVDRQELSGKDGQPIPVVFYIPKNNRD